MKKKEKQTRKMLENKLFESATWHQQNNDKQVWYRNFSHYLVWLTLPHFKNRGVLKIPVIDDYQCCIYSRYVAAAVPLIQAMTSSFVIGKYYIQH